MDKQVDDGKSNDSGSRLAVNTCCFDKLQKCQLPEVIIRRVSRLDIQIILEYAWVLLLLIGLEGLLAADNALVLALMVKHLPVDLRKKALFYGLLGAFVLRFGSLFVVSFLIDIWQVQLIGALYLLGMAGKHLYDRWKPKARTVDEVKDLNSKGSGFWMTVFKVELTDLAFAVDSILAAVALARILPETGLPKIGSMDGGQFAVIFAGGMIGIIIMRFAANIFVEVLQKRPGLELAAFIIVGWVGIKLLVMTLSHEAVGLVPLTWAESFAWKLTFYLVLVAIAACGWIFSRSAQSVHSK